MRIDELTPYKNLKVYKDVHDYRDYGVSFITDKLLKLGYVSTDDVVGSGNFARIFKRKNDPYVIKVFARDSGYLAYLKYVQNHQDNPHVPKIRGKIMKPFKDENLYLVRIEKLEPLPRDVNNYNSAFSELNNYTHINGVILYNEQKGRKLNQDTLVKFAKEQQEFKEKYPQLAALMDDIHEIVKKEYKNYDFHIDNVMVRPSDQKLVITDPLT